MGLYFYIFIRHRHKSGKRHIFNGVSLITMKNPIDTLV